MAQEIEIEFKTLLHYQDFYTLLHALPFPERPVIQINHYFDTANMQLKKNQSALRIREKNGTYTLTLKQAQTKSVLETHDCLSLKECEAWLEGKPVAKPSNQKQLANMHVSTENLIYYGSLETKRYALRQGGLEFVLDESTYLGCHDYELELEAHDYEVGRIAFERLLKQYHITKQKPITKIARFFQAWNKKTD